MSFTAPVGAWVMEKATVLEFGRSVVWLSVRPRASHATVELTYRFTYRSVASWK